MGFDNAVSNGYYSAIQFFGSLSPEKSGRNSLAEVLIVTANRVGTIPVLGSVIGVGRAALGLLGAVVMGVVGIGAFIVGANRTAQDMGEGVTFCVTNVGLGVIEAIPVAGTVAHIFAKARADRMKGY